MADFAPYQDITPERNRALSPPPRSPPPSAASPPPNHAQHSRNASRNIGTVAAQSPTSPTAQREEYFNPGQGWRDEEEGNAERGTHETAAEAHRSWGNRREDVDLFETRLGIRMDWEACLAYLALPPVGGVLLLIFEHTSDYVRYASDFGMMIQEQKLTAAIVSMLGSPACSSPLPLSSTLCSAGAAS